MTTLQPTTPGESQLVLSLFPGIDLLGRGFEAEGFCVCLPLLVESECKSGVSVRGL